MTLQQTEDWLKQNPKHPKAKDVADGLDAITAIPEPEYIWGKMSPNGRLSVRIRNHRNMLKIKRELEAIPKLIES